MALLFVAIVIPPILWLARRRQLLIGWVCLCCCIQLFDTVVLVNLQAARLAGLILLPATIFSVRDLFRARPGKVLMAQVAYLCVLGVVFGVLLPWEPGGYSRSANQLAQGRATLYLIRTLADLGVALIVATEVGKRGRPSKILHYILVGTTVAAVGGCLEAVTRFDFYGQITGLRSLSIEFRMRGFNYEPRGLGLAACQGLLLSVVWFSRKRCLGRALVILLHAGALILSGSTSAVVALAAGLSVLLVSNRVRGAVGMGLAAAAVTAAVAIAISPGAMSAYYDNAILRLSGARFQTEASNWIDSIAYRLEIFDGPALLFLARNPLFALMGTGPGLISLPATAYLPPGEAHFEWLAETGINSPPTMGVLLEVANAGVLGLALWVTFVRSAFLSMRRLGGMLGDPQGEWRVMALAFLAMAGVYLVQVNVSALWGVFLGVGLGAGYLARRSALGVRGARL